MNKIELKIARQQIEKLEQIQYILKRLNLNTNTITEEILNLKDSIYSSINKKLIETSDNK